MSPDDYYNKMVSNKLGRLDLDGICPYTGENDDGSLRQPSTEQLMEWYDLKAAPIMVKWRKIVRRQAEEYDEIRGEHARDVREDDGVPRSRRIYSGQDEVPHSDEQDERNQRGERRNEEDDQ